MKNFMLGAKRGVVLLLAVLSVGFTSQAQAPRVVIKGTVTEFKTGKPLASASVTEVNSSDRQVNGVMTDEEGNFTLRIADTKNKLRIAYIGYESKVVEIGTRTSFSIMIEPDKGGNTDQVIVLAYNKKNTVSTGFTEINKRDLSSAVSTIKGEVFAEQPATSIDQMIQGRAAGVQVVSSSGDPGAGIDIRIRGASSIGSGNDPLFVIDGIPIISTPFDGNSTQTGTARINPLADINPLDIERIDILKDGSGAAIYGSRAANGVVIVTTKRGRKAVTNITFNSSLGFQEAPAAIPVLNAAEYKVMRLEAMQNAGTLNPYRDETRAMLNDPAYFSYQYYQSDTKWNDLIRRTAITQNYSLSLSGGGESVKYNFGTSYTDNMGSSIGTGFQRATSRFNLDYKVSNRLSFSANIPFTRSKNQGLANTSSGGTVYYTSLIKAPSMPVYDVDLTTGKQLQDYMSLGGIQNNLDNPVAWANSVTNYTVSYNLQPNIAVRYDVGRGLNFENTTSLNYLGENGYYYAPAIATGLIWNDGGFNRVQTRDFERTQVVINNFLKYNRTFNKLRVSGLLANTIQTFKQFQLQEGGYANPSSEIQTLNGPSRIAYINTNTSFENSVSYVAQGNAYYNDKYGVSLTVRRDGSSKFGGAKKYATFPGVSGFWRILKEPFMDKLKFVNELKLKGSWGQTGNSGGIGAYTYISQFNAGTNYLGYTGISQSNAELNNLQWEVVEQANIGLEATFFDNRFGFDIDIYKKETKKLIYNQALPSSSGISNITNNLGNIKNQGIELDLQATILRPKTRNGLGWDMSFNIAHSVNLVTELPGGTLTFSSRGYGAFVNQVKQGDALGTYYGLKFLGVYATDDDAVVKDAKGNKVFEANGFTPKYMRINSATGNAFKGGDAIYQDFNNDGVIDDQDRILIGNANPLFFGGLRSNMTYKSFSLTLFCNFQYGNDIINGMRYNLEKMYSPTASSFPANTNQAASVLRRWRKQGDITDMPRALDLDDRNSIASSRWIEDGSYARLSQITFGYALPTKLAQNLRLKGISAQLMINNLFTWTNYTGADPEISISGSPSSIGIDEGQNPRTRGFTFAMTVRF
ncbi:MAG: SusC/RagA family TonB-linked outer membrane protein [Bacteroidota bacterium]